MIHHHGDEKVNLSRVLYNENAIHLFFTILTEQEAIMFQRTITFMSSCRNSDCKDT